MLTALSVASSLRAMRRETCNTIKKCASEERSDAAELKELARRHALRDTRTPPISGPNNDPSRPTTWDQPTPVPRMEVCNDPGRRRERARCPPKTNPVELVGVHGQGRTIGDDDRAALLVVPLSQRGGSDGSSIPS